MNPVIGYGEDALTYWALTQKLQEILNKLHDNSRIEDTVCIYRPSFGRGKGCFGEMDAIIATSEFVYPIESKWRRLSAVKTDPICLAECQMHRRKLFEWYFNHWRDGGTFPDWQTFGERFGEQFHAEFPKSGIVKDRSLLAENLKYLFARLTSKPRTIQHVLLYFTPEGGNRTGKLTLNSDLKAAGFHLAIMGYPPINGSNYFKMF